MDFEDISFTISVASTRYQTKSHEIFFIKKEVMSKWFARG